MHNHDIYIYIYQMADVNESLTEATSFTGTQRSCSASHPIQYRVVSIFNTQNLALYYPAYHCKLHPTCLSHTLTMIAVIFEILLYWYNQEHMVFYLNWPTQQQAAKQHHFSHNCLAMSEQRVFRQEPTC